MPDSIDTFWGRLDDDAAKDDGERQRRNLEAYKQLVHAHGKVSELRAALCEVPPIRHELVARATEADLFDRANQGLDQTHAAIVKLMRLLRK